jgi:nucleoid DNA-binding protein
MSDKLAVRRADFIRDIVNSQGLTYAQAGAAFDSFVKTLEDGICAGAKIQLGKVGAIVPVRLDARPVQMHFRRERASATGANVLRSDEHGTVIRQERTYYIGRRIKFKFRLFKGFINRKTLNWRLD